MSLKKVEQVKKDKGFKIFDLIIYATVLVLVAVLLIVVFTTRNTEPLTGIRIFVDAEEVFSYEFGGTAEAADGVQTKEDDKGITVTVSSTDGDLNVIYIDKVEKSVKMIDANCRGKQCMYFAAITDNNKFIYCNPHNLKIEPYYKDYDNPNMPF